MKLSAKAQKALGRVVEQFETGDLSPVVKIARLRRTCPVPFDHWSFSNRVLAYIQTGSADLRGYRQWQKAGRQVQKGSTAAFIWAPRTKITLGTHDPEVFFHELAHAAHARIEGLRPGQHTDQETIAEFTAAVLMTLYGLGDRTGNAWRYIQRYSENPLTAIQRALSTVEKVLILLEVV